MLNNLNLQVINFKTGFAKLVFFPSFSLVGMVVGFLARFTPHFEIGLTLILPR